METRERYETQEPPRGVPEHIENGQRAASDAPDAPREWFEPDRISVQLVLAKKRGTASRSVKVSEVNYMGPEQQPLVLFADADDQAHPWGTALEKLIAQAVAQAEQQAGPR